MFAVVEFDNNKKEFFVIPLIWLSDDKTSCSWPKNISSEKHLQTVIEELTAPKESWTKYSIRKVHNTTETYSQAHTSLQLILAEGSTGTSELEIQDIPKTPNVETLQKVLENSENSASENCTDEDPTRDLEKKKNVSKKRRKPNTNDKYSSDSEEYHKSEPAKKKNKKTNTLLNFSSSSEEDPLHENNNCIYSQKPTLAFSLSNKGKALAEGRIQKIKDVQVVTPKRFNKFTNQNIGSSSPAHSSKGSRSPNIFFRNSCSTPTGPNIDLTANTHSLTQWQQTVTQDLTRIKLVQEQQSTLLTQIWQTLQVKNVQALQRPPDVPEFPIERKGDFATLEEWLENSQNFNYMRTRLASVGGSTIRSAVMNMLKFVISNRVGMAFNWAGSAPKSPGQPKKYSFKETLTYKALNEAAKICFQGKDQVQGMVGELTDKTIGQACQDWLKLSKQRYNKNTKT